MRPPAAIVTDIEGTTTRISFVHDVLFPYARARLPAFLTEHADTQAVRAALGEIAALAPNVAPLAALIGWMDADAKVTPLKTLQGLIWHEGYRRGDLQSEVYDDVVPAIARWHSAGVRLYVYSSGSEAAQKLLFAHLPQGDMTSLFSGFFDTRVGPKRDPASYQAISVACGLPPADLLFLSDIGAELDAAAAAGWRTCQLLRPADGTAPAAGHAQAESFDVVGVMHGLIPVVTVPDS